MIRSSRRLKDLIRNLSLEKSADAQVLMRIYMMERFLERVSKSAYKDNFILKGGMLVSAMVGIGARSTMDIDTTVKDAAVGLNEIKDMIADIIGVQIDDGVEFIIKNVSEIMDEAEYPGIRVSMEAHFDGAVIPLKIDISTGDVITPCEIRFNYKLMFENRSIDVWAYNPETLLAEKLETVISRATANTRMRDFYDIYILRNVYVDDIDTAVLRDALEATAKKRGTAVMIQDAAAVFDEVEQSPVMEKLWNGYCRKFSYAEGISWTQVMTSVRSTFDM